MKPRHVVAAVLGGLAFLVVPIWAIQGHNFILYRVFAPAYENARRETFENSQAYTSGVAGELAQLQLDYARAASDSERDAIGSVVLQRVASYDVTRLSPDLQAFVAKIKADRTVSQ